MNVTETTPQTYSATEHWPPVQERIDRIVLLLTGTLDMVRDFFEGKRVVADPFATPSWYPPGCDTGCAVHIAGTGVDATVDAKGVTFSHNGFCSVTKPAPRDPIDFNVLRLKRHRMLLRAAEQSLASLDAEIKSQTNPWIVVSTPFRWDSRNHGPAPLDKLGRLDVPVAKRKLETIRDYHGDMTFALTTYLRDRGIEPETRVIR